MRVRTRIPRLRRPTAMTIGLSLQAVATRWGKEQRISSLRRPARHADMIPASAGKPGLIRRLHLGPLA
jgi:hypothetical protein